MIKSKIGPESDYVMFTSGDYYHLATGDWRSHQVPFSSFNIGHRGDTPLLLGRALMTQQDTVMTASNQIFQLDKVDIDIDTIQPQYTHIW